MCIPNIHVSWLYTVAKLSLYMASKYIIDSKLIDITAIAVVICVSPDMV